MREDIFTACLNRYQNSNGKPFWSELAEKFGYPNRDNVSGEKLRLDFKHERFKRGIPAKAEDQRIVKDLDEDEDIEDTSNYKETFSINPDGSQSSDKLISICEQDAKSPEALMKAHGFDPDKWVVVSAKNNYWHGMRPKDAGLRILYQSKLVVKPKSDDQLTLNDIDRFFQNYSGVQKKDFIKPTNYSKDGMVLEIDLADMHVGKMGLTDDFGTVVENCRRTISEITGRIGDTRLKKIILVNLGDVFHYDTFNQTTTGGTFVTSDMDIFSMFDQGASVMIEVIETLAQIAPIDVVNIYGNHDRVLSYSLAKALEFYFRNCKNIDIDAGHSSRKYRKFGNVLVGFAHGDMPRKNIPSILQREARREFGETKFAELHLGHIHHEMSEDKDGVIIRYLPTFAPPDAWHSEMGYVGHNRSTVSFLWDLEEGLKEVWYVNI